jgi:hypothetical protein
MSEAPQLAGHHEVQSVRPAWRSFLESNKLPIAFLAYAAFFIGVLKPTGISLVLMALSTFIILGVLVASFLSLKAAGFSDPRMRT